MNNYLNLKQINYFKLNNPSKKKSNIILNYLLFFILFKF